MNFDFNQIVGNIIGSIMALLVIGLFVYVWGRLKKVIPEKWIYGALDFAKVLVGIVAGIFIVLIAAAGFSYWIGTIGEPAPSLKIVQCEGYCDEESRQKEVKRCHLEAMRFAILTNTSNINIRSKKAYKDFKQCLAINDIKAVDCKKGERQCISFAFGFPDERLGVVPVKMSPPQ